MNAAHHVKLTSAEIAALWTQYMNDTAGLCFNTYMLEHLQDSDIRKVFQEAVMLSSRHVNTIKKFLEDEGFPIPIGFTPQDVTTDAPGLFSDTFCLQYLNIMSIHGCHGYSGVLTTCSRRDIRDYYTTCMASAVELCNQTKDIMLEKGVYFRPPAISPPERPEFIKSDSFLAGWFGEKRPLNCIEISDIYFNLKKSILAKALIVAFSQVAHSKKVREFLLEAVQVKDSHINLFHETLNNEHLPAPPTFDAEITNSTTAPFSDKLMMFQIGFLFSTAMVYYGTGWASSLRTDLTPKYISSIADDMRIGRNWMNIMIEQQWFEQPPVAADRKALAMKKK